jgi:hypothetical protein
MVFPVSDGFATASRAVKMTISSVRLFFVDMIIPFLGVFLPRFPVAWKSGEFEEEKRCCLQTPF